MQSLRAWRMPLVRDALSDLRFAGRWLAKSPGFTLTVVALLALGIGANTAIFSLMNAVLLRTLPVRQPDRLVLFFLGRSNGSSSYMIPQPLYRQIRDRNSVLEEYAAATFPPFTLSAGGTAERVNGLLVSGAFFETLGVPALLGRVLTPEDDRPPVSPPVCVISYALWQRRFGGNPGVIGRKVQLNAHPFTVIGVTPAEFLGLSEDSRLEISVPLTAAGMSDFSAFPVRTFGRLKPDVPLSQAQASLDVLYQQIAPSFAGQPSDRKVVLRPGAQGFSALPNQYGRPLRILLAMVAVVLLIACANVTNLLLARTSGRAKEIALRLAVGAGRLRLVRQLLAENSLLTIGGAVLGIALAYWMDHALLALAPRQVGGGGLILDVRLDWRVLLFTLAVAMLVSVLCGIAPALQSARLDPGPVLKGASGLRAPGRLSFANALVVAQVALSLVLLIGAGLFLRSLHNLQSVDAGLTPERLVVITLDPGTSGYSKTASNQLADRLVERVRALPGVIAASPGFVSPLSGGFARTDVRVPGYQPRPGESDSFAVNWIGADYFKVLGTPVLAGRAFSEQDGRANRVAIVNQKTARHFWPQENPIGKRAVIDDPRDEYEIVGVVKDVRSQSLRQDPEATVYLPFPQNTRPHFVLHVRVAGPTAPVISALLREVHTLASDVAPWEVTTMAAQLGRTMMLDRLMAVLTVLFGLLALVLAAVGLCGVMMFRVATRTREIGIRMALGADYARVLGQVIGEGAVLAAIGLAIGVPIALWTSRFAASFLYGLTATDPVTYAALALLLAAVALGAAWMPARRAARVDPMVALRYE